METITMDGVNAELRPLVRMTAPKQWREQSILQWPTKRPLFKSWVLLFGFFPIDLHSFRLEDADSTTGFREDSSTSTNKIWQHERTVESVSGGCRVTDRVNFENRIPILGTVFKPVYVAVFAHRHRYLRNTFGVID